MNPGVARPEGTSIIIGFVRSIGTRESGIQGILQASGGTRHPSSWSFQGLVVCPSDLTISTVSTANIHFSGHRQIYKLNICFAAEFYWRQDC